MRWALFFSVHEFDRKIRSRSFDPDENRAPFAYIWNCTVVVVASEDDAAAAMRACIDVLSPNSGSPLVSAPGASATSTTNATNATNTTTFAIGIADGGESDKTEDKINENDDGAIIVVGSNPLQVNIRPPPLRFKGCGWPS